ncbi:MAG: membrane protein insertion efficiency factor YidD [Desulfovibrio sp.]
MCKGSPERRKLMRQLALMLIWIYQNCISPMLPGCCRFVPSCSEYARQAYIQHGFIKGSILTFWRLLRCQPLCRGGLDPVPSVFPKTPYFCKVRKQNG